METTTNLSLKKPGFDDYALVSELNDNSDILDSKIGPVGNVDLQTQINNKKNVQAEVSNPTASGTATEFVSEITQNAQGVITPKRAGMPAASTSVAGLVQLNDTLTSPSTSQALTAAKGKALKDEIGNTALPTTAQTLTGAIAEHENDITSVNGMVGDLKSALSKTNEMEELYRTGTGGYIALNGSSADITTIVPDEQEIYYIVSCEEGDQFTINGHGGYYARLWGFIKSDGTILSVEDVGASREDYIITAPKNTSKLIINAKPNDSPSYKGIYISKKLHEEINKFHNNIIPDHISVSSKKLERPKQMDNVLYECGSISGKTTASSYCGFTISIDRPIIGNLLRAEGSRTGGTGNTIRIEFFDESGSRIGSENWTNSSFIEKEIPAETAIANITFASNWASSMEVGSTFTFDDVKIYYADKHIMSFVPDNIKTIVVSGENRWTTANRIYKCDSIQAKTGSASFNGFTFIIKNPVINNILTAKGTKTGGTGSRNIRISFFDKNGTRIGSENWTSGSSISKAVPENAESANVTFAANWGDSMTVGSSFSFSDIQILYSELTESIIGTGQNEYYGEPIILKNSNRINKCTISVWKDFKSADISDLANYCLFANQSMAIYGGYVFLFQQNNGYGQAERPGVVLDYSTKAILSTFSILPNQDQHANSAQFTDIFYDDSDEFPIMMLSRCGGAGIDECQLYRVTRSSNTFTFTLINKIYADYDTVGSSWCIDLNKNIIYNVSKTTERGTDELLIVAWNMPTKSDIISGTSITLQKANRVAQMYSAWLIYQGAYGDGNNLYLGISTTNQNIYVYDVFDGRVVSRIPLTSSREVEGVAIYNEKIYYVQKDDTDTTATNPLTIYEITINN